MGCLSCIPLQTGVIIIFLVHVTEFWLISYKFDKAETQDEITRNLVYLICRIAMLPLFIRSCCCKGDSSELRARKFLYHGYSLLSCFELLIVTWTAMMAFLSWKQSRSKIGTIQYESVIDFWWQSVLKGIFCHTVWSYYKQLEEENRPNSNHKNFANMVFTRLYNRLK